MADLFKGGLQTFDIVVLAIIVVSAVMSLGRGLVREASSVISFIIGGLAAYFAVVFLAKPLSGFFPADWPKWSPAAVLVVVGFFAAYAVAAFIGGRVSKLIHANPEIGLLDRLAGAAFGVVRGALAIVLFVLLMEQVMPREGIPRQIADSLVFPYADTAAGWVRQATPGLVEGAEKTLKPGPAPAKGAAPGH